MPCGGLGLGLPGLRKFKKRRVPWLSQIDNENPVQHTDSTDWIERNLRFAV